MKIRKLDDSNEYNKEELKINKLGGNDGGFVELAERVAKIEAHIEHIDITLEDIKTDIREIRAEIKSNFNWLIGIMITLYATGTIATILTIVFTK